MKEKCDNRLVSSVKIRAIAQTCQLENSSVTTNESGTASQDDELVAA